MNIREIGEKIKLIEKAERYYVEMAGKMDYKSRCLELYEGVICEESDIIKKILYDFFRKN